VLGKYYGYPAQQGTAPRIAIISLGGTFLTSDLQTYWQLLGFAGPLPTVHWVRADPRSTSAADQPITSANTGASAENALDIQIVLGLCPQATITVYFGTNSLLGFYYAFSRAISDGNMVISCSWGMAEIYYGSSIQVFNNLFKTAVARGVTICAAAGDYGSGDRVSTRVPVADFPASSPYVVSCGGTTLNLLAQLETTWSWDPVRQWGSGGGISRIFGKPPYQAAVSAPTGTVPSITSISNGRSLPDISLNADPLTGWSIFYNGQLYRSAFGGTSCVSPAFSALLGLVNRSWPAPYGVHSYLYAQQVGFRDIVEGSNNSLINSVGLYDARVGYDQCTGLGSVDGALLFGLAGASGPTEPVEITTPLISAKAIVVVQLQVVASTALRQWLHGKSTGGVTFINGTSTSFTPGQSDSSVTCVLGSDSAICAASMQSAVQQALVSLFQAWSLRSTESNSTVQGDITVQANAPLLITQSVSALGWRLRYAVDLDLPAVYELDDSWLQSEAELTAAHPGRPFVIYE
jgi:hypothetical protein